MTLRKWLVRGVVFTIAGGAAVGAVAFQQWTNPTAVRQQVLAKLSDYLPAAVVSLESSRLRLLGGISFSDLRLVRKDDPQRVEFITVPTGVIYHDKEQLVNGKLAIRKIEWYKPTIRVIRRKDGTWNLAGVLAPPDPRVQVPIIKLENATILFEDRCDCADLPNLEIKDVDLTITNDPHMPPVESTLAFTGKGIADWAGPIEISGTLGRISDQFTASVQLSGFPVDGLLIQRLAKYWPEVGVHARQLTGVGKLQADLSYHPKAAKPWRHDVQLQLSQGKFTHAQCPFPLENLEAKVRCVDGKVAVERATAQSGPAQLELTAKGITLQADTDFEGSLGVQHFPVSPEFFAHLPPALKEIQDDYQPKGAFSMKLSLQRHGGRWRERSVIHLEDIAGTFQKFPYPLEHVTGTVEQELDESNPAKPIDAIRVDLVGYAGAEPIYIQGEIAGTKPARLDLRIWAKNLPIDEKLRKALPAGSQTLIASFNPSGLVDVEAYIRRPQGDSHAANRYLIRVHHAATRYEVFPYPLEDVAGTVDIQPDHWEFRDFRGTHNKGEFRSQGRSVPTPKGDKIQIEVTGSNILLDKELEAALVEPALKVAWKKLDPSGRMNFEAHVTDLPGQTERDIAVTLTPVGSSLHPEFFRYALTDLHGTIHYHHREVELNNLRARHGPTVVTLDRGKVYLKPDGGLSVDMMDLVGNPVVPDAEFLGALPEALGKTCKTLELKDAFSLLAKRLVVDVPADSQAPPYVYWDGGIRLKEAMLRAGVPFERVNGVIFCRGEHKGSFGKVFGNLQLEQAVLFRQPFQDIHSHIVVTDKEPDAIVFPNLKARLFGGDVGGSIRLDLSQSFNYQVNLRASQIQLNEFGRHNQLAPDAKLTGLAAAALYLNGKGQELSGLEGNGSVDVENGKMYNLPLLLDLLKFLNGRWPDGTMFEEAHVRFGIGGQRADITRLDLLGNAISVGGKGTVSLKEGDINMELYSVWGRVVQVSPPLIKDLWPALSKQLYKIKMRGRIGEPPKFEKEPVPVLIDPVKELLERVVGRGK